MPAPFVVRVLSDDPGSAEALAVTLSAAFKHRQVKARVETGPRELHGTVAAVGVIEPDGDACWISPLAAEGSPDAAARELLTFLERWGFIASARADPAS